MKTIYIVTEGEYSAYHICGVFSTKEAAEEYIAFFEKYKEYSSQHEIGEYIIDEPITEKIKFRYKIEFDPNGTIINTSMNVRLRVDLYPDEPARHDNSVYLNLNEDNIELAKKIAIDEYFQYKTYYKFEFQLRTIDWIKYEPTLVNIKTELLKNIPENTIHEGSFHFGKHKTDIMPYKADIFLENHDSKLAIKIMGELLDESMAERKEFYSNKKEEK